MSCFSQARHGRLPPNGMRADNLLIDLGGTQTRLARGDASCVMSETTRIFRNRDFAGLTDVIAAYLDEVPGPVEGLCAGVAGPVTGGTAQLTNLDWFIDGEGLRAQTGARIVTLINDLQAQGYALEDVPRAAIRQIRAGTPRAGARLIVNLGTGCNLAVVHRLAGRILVPAAEAGHSALSHHAEHAALFDHLRAEHAHLPVEAVLSGPGLARLHARVAGQERQPEEVMQEIESGAAPAQKTLTIFLQILGATLGNFALHHLPSEGIYLSGGLAQSIARHLTHPAFEDAFTNRGPYRDLVGAMPIFLITETTFALQGCHRHLRQILMDHRAT